MKHRGGFQLGIGAEKDGGAEDSLEGLDQAAILRSTLLHAEGVKHLRRATELNRLTLLADRQRSEKDRNEPVLAPWKTV